MDNRVHDESFIANADLSTYQFCYVYLLAGGKVDVAALANPRPFGILQNKPLAGEAAEVRVSGLSSLKVDGNAGAITTGNFLATTDAGVGIKTVTAHDMYAAIALQGSTTANELITVLVTGPKSLST